MALKQQWNALRGWSGPMSRWPSILGSLRGPYVKALLVLNVPLSAWHRNWNLLWKLIPSDLKIKIHWAVNLCIMPRGFEIWKQALFWKDRCELGRAGAAGCGGAGIERESGKVGKRQRNPLAVNPLAERLALWAFTPQFKKRLIFVSPLPWSAELLWISVGFSNTHTPLDTSPRSVCGVCTCICVMLTSGNTHPSLQVCISPVPSLLSILSRYLHPRKEQVQSRLGHKFWCHLPFE